MQSEQQFQQLMLQYTQLKNGAEDIAQMIDSEDYDSAITMIKNREQLFLSCKCIQKYIELTPVQQKELDLIVEELRTLEMSNIKKLEKNIDEAQKELRTFQKSQKIQKAYDAKTVSSGNLLNIQE